MKFHVQVLVSKPMCNLYIYEKQPLKQLLVGPLCDEKFKSLAYSVM